MLKMEIAVFALQVIWWSSIALVAVVVAIDVITCIDDRRDQDAASSRMVIAVQAFIIGAIAKLAKIVLALFGIQ